jgi:RNA polymerase sigma-70 factor (ECF subfamily)
MDRKPSGPRESAEVDETRDILWRQDDMYRQVGEEFGPAIARLASAYERNPTHQEDLLQDIHLAVWQCLANYRGECSLRTWVYRVAHNTAASHILRQRRARHGQRVALEELEGTPDEFDGERLVDELGVLEKVAAIIQRLKSIDRNVLLLYLEGLGAAEIADIVGVSPNLVAQKVHRAKEVLSRHFLNGEDHARR